MVCDDSYPGLNCAGQTSENKSLLVSFSDLYGFNKRQEKDKVSSNS